MDSDQRLSRLLSLALRHRPAALRLELDSAGFALVDAVVRGVRTRIADVSSSDIRRVVAENDKQRFELTSDGAKIRAVQGHSIQVELGLTPIEPPDVLFHGTVAGALDSIRDQGLRPMRRRLVHLSSDAATAETVGARRGAPVVLVVKSGALHASGHEFFVARNGVWLTTHVPPDFLETT